MTPVLWVTWRETLYFSASEVVCFVTKTDPQPQMAKVHRLNQIVGFFFGARDSWDVAFVFCFVTQMAPVQKRPSTVNPVTGLFGNLEAVTESCPTEAGVGVKEVCVCVCHTLFLRVQFCSPSPQGTGHHRYCPSNKEGIGWC